MKKPALEFLSKKGSFRLYSHIKASVQITFRLTVKRAQNWKQSNTYVVFSCENRIASGKVALLLLHFLSHVLDGSLYFDNIEQAMDNNFGKALPWLHTIDPELFSFCAGGKRKASFQLLLTLEKMTGQILKHGNFFRS